MSEIVSKSENQPKGSIPPIHKSVISYDGGSVRIYVHSGQDGDFENEKVLNINIATIGAVDKYKGWHVTELREDGGHNIYVRLDRE